MGTIGTIDRVAIQIGSVSIYWYGVIIGLGVVACDAGIRTPRT